MDTVFRCLHFSLKTINVWGKRTKYTCYSDNVLGWTGPADSLTIPDGFSGLDNSIFSCEISAGKIRRQLPLAASLPGLRLKNRYIPRKYETITGEYPIDYNVLTTKCFQLHLLLSFLINIPFTLFFSVI